LRDWPALARREVASWPTTSNLGLTDGARQILEDLLRLGDQLTEDPGPGHKRADCYPGLAQWPRRGGRRGSTG
jgi:hypothetical protein